MSGPLEDLEQHRQPLDEALLRAADRKEDMMVDVLTHGRTDLQEFARRVVEYLQCTGVLNDETPYE